MTNGYNVRNQHTTQKCVTLFVWSTHEVLDSNMAVNAKTFLCPLILFESSVIVTMQHDVSPNTSRSIATGSNET